MCCLHKVPAAIFLVALGVERTCQAIRCLCVFGCWAGLCFGSSHSRCTSGLIRCILVRGTGLRFGNSPFSATGSWGLARYASPKLAAARGLTFHFISNLLVVSSCFCCFLLLLSVCLFVLPFVLRLLGLARLACSCLAGGLCCSSSSQDPLN